MNKLATAAFLSTLVLMGAVARAADMKIDKDCIDICDSRARAAGYKPVDSSSSGDKAFVIKSAVKRDVESSGGSPVCDCGWSSCEKMDGKSCDHDMWGWTQAISDKSGSDPCNVPNVAAGYPAVSQGEMGFCHSYASSVVYDTYLHTTKQIPSFSSYMTSPAMLGFEVGSFSEFSHKSMRGAGAFTLDAMKDLATSGGCDQRAVLGSDLDKMMAKLVLPADTTETFSVGTITACADIFNCASRWIDEFAQPREGKSADKDSDYVASFCHVMSDLGFKGVDSCVSSFLPAVKKYACKTPTGCDDSGKRTADLIRDLMRGFCSNGAKKKFDVPQPCTTGRFDSYNVDKLLHEGLAATISMKTDGSLCKPGACGDHSMHAMAVVGKKRDADGTCKFIVRNSWGGGCPGAYTDAVSKTCNRGGPGTVLLDPATLEKNVVTVNYFRKDGCSR